MKRRTMIQSGIGGLAAAFSASAFASTKLKGNEKMMPVDTLNHEPGSFGAFILGRRQFKLYDFIQQDVLGVFLGQWQLFNGSVLDIVLMANHIEYIVAVPMI